MLVWAAFVTLLSTSEMHNFPGLKPGLIRTERTFAPEVVQEFLHLNELAFGRQVFELKSCTICQAASDLENLAVYVNPAFLKELQARAAKQEEYLFAVRFILAHEISHYIYELAAEKHGGKSMLGNKSYTQILSEGAGCTEDHKKAHSEVDLIAVLLLTAAGEADAANRAAAVLEPMQASCDGEFRVQRLKETNSH